MFLLKRQSVAPVPKRMGESNGRGGKVCQGPEDVTPEVDGKDQDIAGPVVGKKKVEIPMHKNGKQCSAQVTKLDFCKEV